MGPIMQVIVNSKLNYLKEMVHNTAPFQSNKTRMVMGAYQSLRKTSEKREEVEMKEVGHLEEEDQMKI